MENRATVGRTSSGRVGSALNHMQESFLSPEEASAFVFPVSMLDLKIPNTDASVKCPNKMNLVFINFQGITCTQERACNVCNGIYLGISRNFCWLKPWSLSTSLSVSISFFLCHCNNLFSLLGVNWGRLLPGYSACTKLWNPELRLVTFPVWCLVRQLLAHGSVSLYSGPKPCPHCTGCPQKHLPVLTGTLQRCQGWFLTCYTLLVTCKFSSLLFLLCSIGNTSKQTKVYQPPYLSSGISGWCVFSP